MEVARPVFFESGAHFRRWLEENHDRAKELWFGFYKKGSGRAGVTYAEALDEALCFGWIDGVRKSVDESRYVIRFTPRTPRSVWSAVNIKRVGELTASGRMAEPGLRAFRARDESRSGRYSYEARTRELDPAYERRLRANRKAWAFFQSQAPWYQHATKSWVMSAKKEETRLRRLSALIEGSARGERLPQFTLAKRPGTPPGR